MRFAGIVVYTSIAHHMSKTRCQLLASDAADNFSKRYFVISQNNCRHNYIAIYNFMATWLIVDIIAIFVDENSFVLPFW